MQPFSTPPKMQAIYTENSSSVARRARRLPAVAFGVLIFTSGVAGDRMVESFLSSSKELAPTEAHEIVSNSSAAPHRRRLASRAVARHRRITLRSWTHRGRSPETASTSEGKDCRLSVFNGAKDYVDSLARMSDVDPELWLEFVRFYEKKKSEQAR